MSPAASDVRAQLERIVASPVFANADRMTEFLRFVVGRALAGEGDQVKEYVIGVEVFKRDAEYDPRLDSIVRVEARRLRTKIDEYYAGPGREDPIVIRIPRGSYVPTFDVREIASASPHAVASTLPNLDASAAVAPVAAPIDTRRRAGVRLALGLMAITIALVLVAAWRTGVWATNDTKPAIAVLPFAQFSGDPADDLFAADLTDRVTSELARLRTVGVISRTSAARFANAKRPLREIAQALEAELLIEGTVRRDGDLVRVDARLVSAVTDHKVWVETFMASTADLNELPRRIAASASAAAIAVDRRH
jgi:TolB-like protein